MKKRVLGLGKDFLLACMAGVSISVGCVAYLSSGSKIIGSLVFAVGLFMIIFLNFNLYTGKICFALGKKPSYILDLAVIWLGDFLGAAGSAQILSLTRLSSLYNVAQGIVAAKLTDGFLSLFVLGVCCNIMIFLAVYGVANFKGEIAKMLALLFGVSIFVLCGFEHCVADMFYFTFARAWSFDAILRILVITLGNTVGGLLVPVVMKITKKD
ncbi:MAG: formate/nitrite transporter family protein [Clostridia bacterium]|nr:formate/nitrite transporter family protein [Clostridia bacterium]